MPLKQRGNFNGRSDDLSDPMRAASPRPALSSNSMSQPFLRIPPFPGACVGSFIRRPGSPSDVAAVARALRNLRVGGTYWGRQPELPNGHVLVRLAAALKAIPRSLSGGSTIVWEKSHDKPIAAYATLVVTGDCDPWHMLSGASALVAEPDDEVRLIAALLDVPCYDFDARSGEIAAVAVDAEQLIAETLCRTLFENPFSGEVMDTLAAVELCGFWRRLIDSNRDIGGGIGFAFWKQAHVAPLLWNGSSTFRFLRGDDCGGDCLAVWRSKVSGAVMGELENRQIKFVEVEDGFLRSRGLGADCIPPLSITVDRLGAHFDPARPSELEHLLEEGAFDQGMRDRARELRRLIVAAGIGKYESGTGVLDRRETNRLHVLVPGQVEDDRAVIAGGCGLVSNLALLKRVREHVPDAYVLYKPHPDVLAGHRRGTIPDRDCLELADEIVGELPIAALIDLVDEVHVNSSLAGFEALLRGKAVTTYGVPFYAGWGLTRDLGPVPTRRTSRRTIDELVVAALLLYPRYFDPVTGLPCPAEVVVERLSTDDSQGDGFVVGMRRLQGKFLRHLRSLVQ